MVRDSGGRASERERENWGKKLKKRSDVAFDDVAMCTDMSHTVGPPCSVLATSATT